MKSKNNSDIFDTLLQLPLLEGASRARLKEIVGNCPLDFVKATDGEIIVEPGQSCDSVIFLLSGSVRQTVRDASEHFVVSQTLTAPQVIAPEHLFGLQTTYPCQVEAIDNVGLMKMTKEDYVGLLHNDSVFFFNYLNMVCANSQRAALGLLSVAGGSAFERLNYWISTLTRRGATDIELHSEGRDLHLLLGVSAAALRNATARLDEEAYMPDAQTLCLPSR